MNHELDDYASEDEANIEKDSRARDEGSISAATLQLMEQLGENPFKASREAKDEDVDEVKIYYCSRTHSQLTQFVQELRRVKLPIPDWMHEALQKEEVNVDHLAVKHVPLASRKNLCINEKVLALGSVSAINERCLELQDAKTSKEHKCPFIPKKDSEPMLEAFKDQTLAVIRDIEEVGFLGKKMGICPYYATRSATKPSEVFHIPFYFLHLGW